MAKCTLPYPPTANRYWRTGRGGRPYVSAEAQEYKQTAGWLANAAGIDCLQGNIKITLKFYRPTKQGDLDNRIKVLLDSLNGIAWGDDKQIVEIHAYRYEAGKRDLARVEVEIDEA